MDRNVTPPHMGTPDHPRAKDPGGSFPSPPFSVAHIPIPSGPIAAGEQRLIQGSVNWDEKNETSLLSPASN